MGPFLHCTVDLSRWSETGILRKQRVQEKTEVLKRVQRYLHRLPKVIRADQKFNKPFFILFCFSLEIRFVSVAANHHESNGMLEKANRKTWEQVNRLALLRPGISLNDLVTAATFHKNILRGHKKSSQFGMLFNPFTKVTRICDSCEHESIADNFMDTSQGQLNAG